VSLSSLCPPSYRENLELKGMEAEMNNTSETQVKIEFGSGE
jgi:hypothetical protein